MARPHNLSKKNYQANVFTMNLYEVRGENDSTEGRGGTHLVGWFTSSEIADKAAEGKGVMGYKGTVNPHTKVVVTYRDDEGNDVTHLVGEQILVQYEDPKEVRARGLAKLTPAERHALGLK
jgi:hypothetical protein